MRRVYDARRRWFSSLKSLLSRPDTESEWGATHEFVAPFALCLFLASLWVGRERHVTVMSLEAP